MNRVINNQMLSEMKTVNKTILGALILIVLMSATTVSVMTVKPAKPISTIVETGRMSSIKQFILKYSKHGYVVKEIGNYPEIALGGDNMIVVMEKY